MRLKVSKYCDVEEGHLARQAAHIGTGTQQSEEGVKKAQEFEIAPFKSQSVP